MEHLSNLTDPLTILTLNPNSSIVYSESSLHLNVRKMQTVVVPLICLLGLLGNVLAVGCFLSQSLRGTSCCLYMAAKCLSDTAFLAALFVMWLHRVHVNAVNVQGVCQLTIFVSYVSGFVSVWLVLAITYENYIRICRPHLSNTHCVVRVALSVIALIVVFALFLYNFALWTNTVLGDGEEEEEAPLCMAMTKFKDVLMVMTFIDTAMTLVLPTIIIVPLVLATLVAVVRAVERKKRLRDPLYSAKRSQGLQSSLEARVAFFLLAVSLTFLLLHTPGHLIRLKVLVDRYIRHKGFTELDSTLQRLFETLYYFNFCCSIVIFLGSGANFRALFLAMYCKRIPILRSLASSSLLPQTLDKKAIKMNMRGSSGQKSYSTCTENSGLSRKDSNLIPPDTYE